MSPVQSYYSSSYNSRTSKSAIPAMDQKIRSNRNRCSVDNLNDDLNLPFDFLTIKMGKPESNHYHHLHDDVGKFKNIVDNDDEINNEKWFHNHKNKCNINVGLKTHPDENDHLSDKNNSRIHITSATLTHFNKDNNNIDIKNHDNNNYHILTNINDEDDDDDSGQCLIPNKKCPHYFVKHSRKGLI